MKTEGASEPRAVVAALIGVCDTGAVTCLALRRSARRRSRRDGRVGMALVREVWVVVLIVLVMISEQSITKLCS